MAHEGHIYVKNDKKNEKQRDGSMNIRQFFTAVDKGSSRPAFCLPRHFEAFKETTVQMRRALDNGFVAPDRKMAIEEKYRQHNERLKSLEDNRANAAKIIKEDPDAWAKRRSELAEEISNSMPKRSEVNKKRINPFRNLKTEKSGLEAKKQEYIIISKAMQAAGYDVDSNITFLEKD